jgi:hypothetical protein
MHTAIRIRYQNIQEDLSEKIFKYSISNRYQYSNLIRMYGFWSSLHYLLWIVYEEQTDVTTALQPHKSKHSSELNCYTKEHKLVGLHRAHVKFNN